MMEGRARYGSIHPPCLLAVALTGLAQDGLSIICVILRHIDTENIDFDTILYCYLKVSGSFAALCVCPSCSRSVTH